MENPPVLETKPKRKSVVVLLIVLLLLLLCIVLALFFAYLSSRNNTQTNQSTEVTNTENTEVQTPEDYQFSGEYLSATLPTKWSIKEYSDVTGMKYYVEGENMTLSGLTGLDVIDENNDVVFSLRGVDGIGGASGCSEIGVFSDTNSSYVQGIQVETAELGFGVTEQIDLTDVNYSSITMLGERLRRVDIDFYSPDQSNLEEFNTLCGINAQFLQIEAINFTVNNNGDVYSSSAYSYGITDSSGIGQETLIKLDQVLNSFEVN